MKKTKTAVAERWALEQVRSFWQVRQRLLPDGLTSLLAVVDQTGWIRTLGGADAYVALYARATLEGGLSREKVDEALETGTLQVVPAVRGCIYLLPRADVPVALAIADELSRRRVEREMEKVGVPMSEIQDVATASLEVLKRGAATTDGIKAAFPPGTVRSLGEVGKKIGVSSTLPTALRQLEFSGRVQRFPQGGRLDTERYIWRVSPEPLDMQTAAPPDQSGRILWLLDRFYSFAGPAPLAEFLEWSGLSARDVRAAVPQSALVPVAVEGLGDDVYVRDSDRALVSACVADAQHWSPLPFEDNMLALHGGPGLFVDSALHGRSVRTWGSSTESLLGEARHLGFRALLQGGRLRGFWEFDPDAQAVVAGLFSKPTPTDQAQLEQRLQGLTELLRDGLGHGRSFSLDSVESMRSRIAAFSDLHRLG